VIECEEEQKQTDDEIVQQPVVEEEPEEEEEKSIDRTEYDVTQMETQLATNNFERD